MIIVESKRKRANAILRKYLGAIHADVTIDAIKVIIWN
jgi:hypothetical protein